MTIFTAEAFQQLVQKAAIRYQKPYDDEEDTRPFLANRRRHGVVHAMMTTHLVDVWCELLRQHRPDLMTSIDEETQLLLKATAMYHDAANTSEKKGIAQAHAAALEEDLIELLQPESIEEFKKKLAPFCQAIINKDSRRDGISLFAFIIHEVDCFEIRRSRGNRFNRSYLLSLQSAWLGVSTEFSTQLDRLILAHKETTERIYQNKYGQQARLEYATEPYEALHNFLLELLQEEIFLLGLIAGKVYSKAALIDFDWTSLNLTPLQLFDRDETAAKLISAGKFNGIAQKNIEDYGLVQQDLPTRRLMRVVQDSKSEEKLLAETAEQLKKQQISSSETLRQARDIRFRPGSYAVEGTEPYHLTQTHHGATLIINAEASSVIIACGYKGNVSSYKAFRSPEFFQQPTAGGKKRLGSLDEVEVKVKEIAERRAGTAADGTLRYFKQATAPFSEVLFVYQPEAIHGIDLRTIKADDIKKTLLAWFHLSGDKQICFYLRAGGHRKQLTVQQLTKQLTKQLTLSTYPMNMMTIPAPAKVHRTLVSTIYPCHQGGPISSANPVVYLYTNEKDNLPTIYTAKTHHIALINLDGIVKRLNFFLQESAEKLTTALATNQISVWRHNDGVKTGIKYCLCFMVTLKKNDSISLDDLMPLLKNLSQSQVKPRVNSCRHLILDIACCQTVNNFHDAFVLYIEGFSAENRKDYDELSKLLTRKSDSKVDLEHYTPEQVNAFVDIILAHDLDSCLNMLLKLFPQQIDCQTLTRRARQQNKTEVVRVLEMIQTLTDTGYHSEKSGSQHRYW